MAGNSASYQFNSCLVCWLRITTECDKLHASIWIPSQDAILIECLWFPQIHSVITYVNS